MRRFGDPLELRRCVRCQYLVIDEPRDPDEVGADQALDLPATAR
jgi:hypothetical protein